MVTPVLWSGINKYKDVEYSARRKYKCSRGPVGRFLNKEFSSSQNSTNRT
jgi:hypothetical protein